MAVPEFPNGERRFCHPISRRVLLSSRLGFGSGRSYAADGPLEVIERFRDEEPAPQVRALRSEIEKLLECGTSEEEWSQIWLEDGEVSHDPRVDRIALSEWFHHVYVALA
jgi:hypothetical protein